ncbi:hypothetical protein ACER0A_010420 [Haloimpatiens sp. FM7315]|uniref:hypothetical protein n=1 Tax=Haloimpatiens sp. FM7315 TaxID=3298609 RepID=UPI0035A26D2C
MKGKKIILSLTMCTLIALGTTVYASSNVANSGNASNSNNKSKVTSNYNGVGLKRATGIRGYDYISSIIKEKFNLTDEDINKSLSEGKTLKGIANEKGLSDEELKNSLITSKTKAIDEAVSKGTITKEEGETIKNNIKTNSANCSLGENSKNRGNNQGNNKGKGKNGGGRQNNQCVLNTEEAK